MNANLAFTVVEETLNRSKFKLTRWLDSREMKIAGVITMRQQISLQQQVEHRVRQTFQRARPLKRSLSDGKLSSPVEQLHGVRVKRNNLARVTPFDQKRERESLAAITAEYSEKLSSLPPLVPITVRLFADKRKREGEHCFSIGMHISWRSPQRCPIAPIK